MRKRSRRNNSLEDVLAEWEQQHHNHLHISNNNGGNPIQKKQAKGSKRGCMKGKGGPENSSCTYRGVRQRASGKWVVEIREPNGGKRRWLGTYDTSLEAAQAYDKAAKEMYGTCARLNIPLDSTSSVSETTTSASHRSDGSSYGSAVSDNVDDELFDEELERALLMEIGDDEAGCGEQKRARLNLPLGLTSVSEISTSASHHSDGSAGSDDVDDGLFDEELERALLTESDDDEAGCGEQKHAHLNLLPLDSTSVSETTTTSDQHSDGSAGSGVSEQTMQMYEALDDDRKMRKRSRRNNSLEDVLAEWEQQHRNHLHISNNNGGNPIQKKQAKGSKRGCMKGKGGPENSSCTYRGVRQRASGKWVVEIREPNGGKRRWLGTYDTSLEAAQAYDKAAKEIDQCFSPL
ncbi:Dehydration-responsive element-binding protein 2A [Acorus calamus]|uniref:Dehydration-responsive element-binding protein 2A n=1 Tax=Acorus calamus TaxID=4465 RepID=A0AAV9C5U1_ACOCL|nr:Dehydration-responsive element-binding protein 2A [Acorus calamus]